MTNFQTNDIIKIEGIEIEKVDQYKYLGQTIVMEDRTASEVQLRIKAGWSVSGRYKEIFLNKELPMCLKRKVFNQCINPTLTYGYSHKRTSQEDRSMPKKDGKKNPRY